MKWILILILSMFFVSLHAKSITLNIKSDKKLPEYFKEIIINNLIDYGFKNIIAPEEEETDDSELYYHERISEENEKEDKKANTEYSINLDIKKKIDYYSSKLRIKITLKNNKNTEVFKKVFFYKGKMSNEDKFRVFTEKMMIKFFESLDKQKERKKQEELAKLPKTPTKKDILNMIRSAYPYLKDCATAFEFSGQLNISFDIKNTGVVENIKFKTQMDETLKECMLKYLKEMKTIKFQKEKLTINIPLNFKNKEKKPEKQKNKKEEKEKTKKYEEIY